MKTFLKYLNFILILQIFPAYAAIELKQVAQGLGDFNSFVVNDEIAYISSDCGDLQIASITDNNIRILSSLPLSACSTQLLLDKSRQILYVLSKQGVEILDISDALQPQLINYYDSSNSSKFLLHQDGFLYLADYQSLEIIDVSDIKQPRKIREFNLAEDDFLRAISIQGDYAYLSLNKNRLQIVDISQPEINAPQSVAEYEAEEELWSVTLRDGQAYLYTGIEEPYAPIGLEVLDVSKPSKPILLHRHQFDTEQSTYLGRRTIHFQGDNAYLFSTSAFSSISSVLTILDISNLAQIEEKTRLRTNINYLQIQGQRLYGLNAAEFSIIDVSITDKPQILLEQTLPNSKVGDLHKLGDKLYSRDGQSLKILNQDLHTVGEYIPKGERFTHLALQGQTAFALFSYSDQLTALDVSDDQNIKEIGAYHFEQGIMFFRNILLQGQRAYIGHHRGLEIVDISNPEQMQGLGSYETEEVQGLALVGNTLYLSSSKTLQILDIQQPDKPQLLGQLLFNSDELLHNISVVGQYAYVTTGYNGLWIVDISQANDPVIVSKYQGNHRAWTIQVENNRAYLGGDSGLDILDVSNPSKPLLLASKHEQGLYDFVLDLPYIYASTVNASLGYQGGHIKKFQLYETAQSVLQTYDFNKPACALGFSALMTSPLDQGQALADLPLLWQEMGKATTEGGDAVLTGYFYADPAQVSWGSEANPEVFAKIWFSRKGELNLNFFHVGVFDVHLNSIYNQLPPKWLNGGMYNARDNIGIARKAWRYARHDYPNWRVCADDASPLVIIPPALEGQANAKVRIDEPRACDLNLNANMLKTLDNGADSGDIQLRWHESTRSQTIGGDTVIAGYFYADEQDVSWGNSYNPEAYAKLWFSRDGGLSVNFFHVGVFDIELDSDYNGLVPVIDGSKTISIKSYQSRYARHDYANWRLCQ